MLEFLVGSGTISKLAAAIGSKLADTSLAKGVDWVFSLARSAPPELVREHYSQLRSTVLKPISDQLATYYLPSLEGRVAVVDTARVPVYKERASAIEDTYQRTEFRLRVKLPTSTLSEGDFPYDSPRPGTVINPELYEDAKANHYQRLLVEWEELTQRCRERLENPSLQYVQQIHDELVEKLQLPVLYAGGPNAKYWASYAVLAAFIYRHRLGVSQCHLRKSTNVGEISIYLSPTQEEVVRCASPEDLDRVLRILGEVADSTGNLVELRRTWPELEAKGKELLKKLSTETASLKLPGKCNLI